VGRCRARKKGVRGSDLQGCPTEKASREARCHEDNTRIEDGSPDLHRQVDTRDFVFAQGTALPTRAVAPAPRECLPANAYPDASQIQRAVSEVDALDGLINNAGVSPQRWKNTVRTKDVKGAIR
jgi:hypothetical protein